MIIPPFTPLDNVWKSVTANGLDNHYVVTNDTGNSYGVDPAAVRSVYSNEVLTYEAPRVVSWNDQIQMVTTAGAWEQYTAGSYIQAGTEFPSSTDPNFGSHSMVINGVRLDTNTMNVWLTREDWWAPIHEDIRIYSTQMRVCPTAINKPFGRGNSAGGYMAILFLSNVPHATLLADAADYTLVIQKEGEGTVVNMNFDTFLNLPRNGDLEVYNDVISGRAPLTAVGTSHASLPLTISAYQYMWIYDALTGGGQNATLDAICNTLSERFTNPVDGEVRDIAIQLTLYKNI